MSNKTLDEVLAEIKSLEKQALELIQQEQIEEEKAQILLKKQGTRLLAEKEEQIRALLKECETIAEEYDVTFYWQGPTYGMGGGYYPKSSYSPGWQSSSAEC